MPWLCAGDFNEIHYHHEKEAGVPRSQGCLNRFRGALEICELHDLGFTGDVFTWRNKETKGCNHIRERLDRAVANSEWRDKFPMMQVKNGDTYHSDHRPVIIVTEAFRGTRGPHRTYAFKFEANWLQEEDCRRVVEEAWEALDELSLSLRSRLEGVSSLKEWSSS